jgi:hypothetical protein
VEVLTVAAASAAVHTAVAAVVADVVNLREFNSVNNLEQNSFHI